MKSLITPEHKTATAIFLAIFALTALFFFSSCEIQRDCPGAGKGFVGCGSGQFAKTKMTNRKSY